MTRKKNRCHLIFFFFFAMHLPLILLYLELFVSGRSVVSLAIPKLTLLSFDTVFFLARKNTHILDPSNSRRPPCLWGRRAGSGLFLQRNWYVAHPLYQYIANSQGVLCTVPLFSFKVVPNGLCTPTGRSRPRSATGTACRAPFPPRTHPPSCPSHWRTQ